MSDRQIRSFVRRVLESAVIDEDDELQPVEEDYDLKLPKGKQVILKAETDKHARGLVVKWRDDGGYDVYYWYGSPDQPVAAELKADGESVGDAVKMVYLGFHPEIDEVSVSASVGGVTTPLGTGPNYPNRTKSRRVPPYVAAGKAFGNAKLKKKKRK